MDAASDVKPANHNREWDRSRVIEHIQCRQQEGKAMNYASLRGDDYSLLGVAGRCFGSCASAVGGGEAEVKAAIAPGSFWGGANTPRLSHLSNER